jgi:ADP-ribosylglycohydrolase
MKHPHVPDFAALSARLELEARLKLEYGAPGLDPVLRKAEKAIRAASAEIRRLPADRRLSSAEPNDLPSIRRLRPAGPRRLWQSLDPPRYRERLAGALLGRMAGCVLGAPVELWPVARMAALAEETGAEFPPVDYWPYVPEPAALRYATCPRSAYTRAGMHGVPVDDDIAYTLLGLLILEEHGPDFSTEAVGKAWMKYLPFACTAEEVALKNLKAGSPASRAAEKDNPFCEWIGADIRADPWGYAAPGWPERAAELAYRDAYVSHRRQGIYGEMFFAAAIAAAFAVDDPVEALRIGLTEIPAACALSKAVRWALAAAPGIRGYKEARNAIEKRFPGMNPVHTVNNACLTIWGLTIGGTDFSRVIGETVAMGLDNDCTAATAGSIVGAVAGKRGIPRRWYRRFDDTIHSYLIGKKSFKISGVLRRFEKQARIGYGGL